MWSRVWKLNSCLTPRALRSVRNHLEYHRTARILFYWILLKYQKLQETSFMDMNKNSLKLESIFESSNIEKCNEPVLWVIIYNIAAKLRIFLNLFLEASSRNICFMCVRPFQKGPLCRCQESICNHHNTAAQKIATVILG